MDINLSRTNEIIFHSPHPRKNSNPVTLIPSLGRIKEVKLLGVIINSHLQFDAHIKFILGQCGQRMYALRLMRDQGLSLDKLSIIFQAIVVSRIMYALSAWGGILSVAQIGQINAFFRRAKRYGLVDRLFLFEDLLEKSDQSLFNRIVLPTHCLHHLLPDVRSSQGLRDRGHNFQLPLCKTKLFRETFFPRCLFKYLHNVTQS